MSDIPNHFDTFSINIWFYLLRKMMALLQLTLMTSIAKDLDLETSKVCMNRLVSSVKHRLKVKVALNVTVDNLHFST